MIDISIIVPVYNGKSYIEKCINSVLNKTRSNIEIIIINDGSTDDTQLVIEGLALKNRDKIAIYNLENNGVGKARNYGLQLAKGKYVAFLDSDDYILDGMYDILYEKAELENLDLVICGYYRVDDLGNILFSEMILENFDLSKVNSSPWNKIFKKDFLIKYNIKFGEEIWYEDVQFIVNSLAITQKVGYIKKELYCYVQRDNSSINQFSTKVEDIFIAVNNILDFCKNIDIDYERELVEYHIIMHLVFGHLSRCANEKNLFKRHEYIKKTRLFFKVNIPRYYKNKYFKIKNLINEFSLFSLMRFLGLLFFKLNMYDILLLVYKLSGIAYKKKLKRW